MKRSSMTKSPFKTHRLKTAGIVIGSILVIAGIGAATFFILNQVKPVQKTTQETPVVSSAAETARKKAEELLQKGDNQGALDNYKIAADAYKTEGNQAGASDAEMQVKVIEATVANTEQLPDKPEGRVSVGGAE